MFGKTIINSTEMRELVSKQVGPLCGTVFSLYVSDERYYCPSKDDVQAILVGEQLNQTEYMAEAHDCDDYSHLAMSAFIRDAYREGKRRPAYAFGMVFSMGHAFNWFVDSHKQIQFVEPQTSEIYPISDFPGPDAVVFMLV